MNKDTTQTNTKFEACNRMVQQIVTKKSNYQSAQIPLSNMVNWKMYDEINKIKTHQNGGFLTALAKGQTDDRKSYDIITPMVDTSVVNIDIDTENFDTYATKKEYDIPAFIIKSPLQTFLKQSNQGEVINDIVETFCDDGNVIVRKDNKPGQMYSKVHPLNLAFTDISAKDLEETGVIETQIINQNTLMSQKDWVNKEIVKTDGNVSPVKEIPFYEIDYYYDEVEEYELNKIKQELGQKVEDGDEGKFIPSLVIKAKLVPKENNQGKVQNGFDETSQGLSAKGIIVFAEELPKEEVKINKKITITRYKPYEFVGFGKFNGRLWREGLRERGRVYQNTANEIGTRISRLIKLMRAISWTDDEDLFGMNIMSSLKDGQVITVKQGRQFNVINNQFPIFSSLIEEWNRNLNEARTALKAYEVASGETSPSSASATAIAIQNQAVGRYFKFKRQKLELFFSAVYNRWVIPQLIDDLESDEVDEIEISGDPAYMDKFTGMMAGAMIQKGMTEEPFHDVKRGLLKEPKHYLKKDKGFFKDAEIYIGLNPGGEAFNKQSKITNGINLMPFYTNPNIYSFPAALSILNQIALSLGFKVDQANTQPQGTGQPVSTPNMPQTEQRPTNQVLNNNI